MAEFAQIVAFVVQACCRSGCGVEFATTKEFDQLRLAKRDVFFCPNGHSQNYIGKTEAQREREARLAAEAAKQLAESNATFWRNRASHESASKRAVQGHATRLKKRVAHGVCPCCKRTFAALVEHMKSQHPEYVVEAKAS